jgi:hypothetical protein
MTYFPPVPAPVPEKCPGCGAWYIRPSGVHVGCCVAHSPGTCCHFGETKVEAPLEPELGPRRFGHNEVAAVVRNELVKDKDALIYSFAAGYNGARNYAAVAAAFATYRKEHGF